MNCSGNWHGGREMILRLGVSMGLGFLLSTGSLVADDIPASVREILSTSCLECHDAETEKGEINLEQATIEWSHPEDRERWLRVLEVVDQGLMPPPKKGELTEPHRKKLLDYLDARLLKHTEIGGTPPRRLSRDEYQATIRELLYLPTFTLPTGFPNDTELHGFNNVAEGLVLSSPHLEAYANVAQSVADEIFPPVEPPPKVQRWEAGPEDLVLSFSASAVHDGALRLASRSVDIMRSCTWPSRIEIEHSGTYRIAVDAAKFLVGSGRGFDRAMLLEVYARPVAATDRSKVGDFRLLNTIEVTQEQVQTSTFEADLYKGETVLFRWSNAEMTHDPPRVHEAFETLARHDPRFLAAWLKVIFPSGNPSKPRSTAPLRGRNGWEAVARHMADSELDLTHAGMDSALAKAFFAVAAKGKTSIADCLCSYYHTHGPALEIHRLSIEGPSKLVQSPADRTRQALQFKITGKPRDGQDGEAFVRDMLARFLPRAFRRPVSEDTIDSYLAMARRHAQAGNSPSECMHLLLRNILVSPRFLYRSLASGPMDDWDLATRLSYFLTQRPPDSTLIDLAERNRLSITRSSETDSQKPEYWVIRREAERLMPKVRTDPMIQSFVGQWLGTQSLHEIMPDPKFNFSSDDIDLARYETESFFTAILNRNQPMETFIDPSFTYASIGFVKRNYGFTPQLARGTKNNAANRTPSKLQRLVIPQGGRYGGLLGQAAIFMTTANGVDTQPVVRGVWVLENLLGMEPPPPPEDVPALTPDTQKAQTPRELLTAHTADAACVGCHQRIDPVGLVLENYDPVGRWRTTWPGTGEPIDPSVSLSDGTQFADPTEFKAWLVENIDLFAGCLAEKLMIYATGRLPNYAEQQEIKSIVQQNKARGNGFRDLILALVESETFRTN